MVTFKVEGGAELAKALEALSTRLSVSMVRSALREGGELIRRSAERNAPRSDEAPHIGDNIGIGNAMPGDDMAAIKIGPVKGFAYGIPQEFGTVHHAAHPFMRPAFDTNAQKALGVIGQELWRQLAARGVQRSVTADVSVGSEGRFL